MKKFLSLFAAVLFAGSMMAIDFTLSSANAVTQDGVTVTFAKGTGNNAPAWYDAGLRLYANNTVTITSESNIASITFNWEKQGQKPFAACTASTGSYTHPEAAGAATWTGSANSVTFTVGASGQLQLNTFSVTLEGGQVVPPTPAVATPVISGDETFTESVIVTITCATPEADIYYTIDGTTDPKCDCAAAPEYTQQIVLTSTTTIMAAAYTGNDWSAVATKTFTKVEPVVLQDPTNCAEAAEAALSVENNNDLYNNGAVYSITGYVTSIQTAYSSQYNNVSFWIADAADGGNVIQAYRAACTSADDAPIVGDKVTVTGSLTKYNSTPEFAAGCTYVIVEHATPAVPENLGEKTIAEFLALANTVDTCIVTGVVYNIYNTTYGNLYLVDGTDTLNVYGVLTPEGQNMQFESLNVAEGDTLTVKAIYSIYNGKPQAKNAIFVAVKKAAVTPIEPTEITIDIETEVNFIDHVAAEGWWQFIAENDEYEISISNVSTTQAAGTYTIDDLDPDYSYITIKATNTDVTFEECSLVLTEGENGSRTIEGTVRGSDGNTYNIKLVFVVPTAQTTVNVEIPEWEVYDGTGYYGFASIIFMGEAEDGTYVQFAIYGSNPLGDFTYDDCYNGGIEVAGKWQNIYSMDIHINVSDANRAIVTMDILCLDNTLYHVTTTIGEGFENVDAAVKAIKKMVNGNIIIEKNGVKYTVNGARL